MAAHINGAELNFTTPQGAIAIRRWGLGPSFLLLPGLGGSSASWGKVPHLIKKSGAAALAVTPPLWWYEPRLTLAQRAETLAPLVRVLGKPVVVGWSLGAQLALELAKSGQVQACCLITPDSGEKTEAAGRLYRDGPSKWAHHIAEALLPGESQGEQIVSRSSLDEATLQGQYLDLGEGFVPEKVSVPTLVIAGQKDVLCPPEAAHRLAQSLEAELKVLDGGHGLPWTQSEELVELLLELLPRT